MKTIDVWHAWWLLDTGSRAHFTDKKLDSFLLSKMLFDVDHIADLLSTCSRTN